jgi:phosphoribosylpyrophosphate synthetase
VADGEKQPIAKLSRLENSQWVHHRYAGSFRTEVAGKENRLVVAPSAGAVSLIRKLASQLSSPVLILWVLHTSRVGSELGRYQSPPVSVAVAQQLLQTYAEFLENDARSDIWFHSRTPAATIVFERHGLIYAYGLPAEFRGVLESVGLSEGTERIPSPHAHNYHPKYDSAEAAMVQEYDWNITPLQPGDEQ